MNDTYPVLFSQKPVVGFIPGRHWRKRTVKIHDSFYQFDVTAAGIIISKEMEYIVLMHRIPKKKEDIQTLDIKFGFDQVLLMRWADPFTLGIEP